jgi:hypothetical protein
MNLIQRQAKDFLHDHLYEYGKHKEFVAKVKSESWEYNKTSHKIQFLEQIILGLKKGFDEHLSTCRNECDVKKFYENSLFFLQEELEELESNIETQDFNRTDKTQLIDTLNKILEDLNMLKLGQQISYDDFALEFEELKDMLFLDKKNWSQLFIGKLTEMIASGVISETISKEITETIKSNYPNLFKA